jgi:hypothetical protein
MCLAFIPVATVASGGPGTSALVTSWFITTWSFTKLSSLVGESLSSASRAAPRLASAALVGAKTEYLRGQNGITGTDDLSELDPTDVKGRNANSLI